MKVGAVTIAFNEEKLIRGALESLKPFVDKHVVLLSTRPYYGPAYPPDRTEEICKEHGAIVIKSWWQQEHRQRNIGQALLSDYDVILTTDADMWYEHSEVEKMLKSFDKKRNSAYVTPQLAYFHDIDHVLEGDDFCPVAMVTPNVKFRDIGCVDRPVARLETACHHLNWCAPKDVFKKLQCYSHAPEFNGVEWYKDVYLDWEPGKPITMPDGKTFNVIESPLPNELRKYISV